MRFGILTKTAGRGIDTDLSSWLILLESVQVCDDKCYGMYYQTQCVDTTILLALERLSSLLYFNHTQLSKNGSGQSTGNLNHLC